MGNVKSSLSIFEAALCIFFSNLKLSNYEKIYFNAFEFTFNSRL